MAGDADGLVAGVAVVVAVHGNHLTVVLVCPASKVAVTLDAKEVYVLYFIVIGCFYNEICRCNNKLYVQYSA